MFSRFRRLNAATAVGMCLTLMLLSCGDNRPGPSEPGRIEPPPPPPPSAPTVVRMELVAPAEIAPGESVQLIAKATKSDGSVEDVTSHAVWGAGPPSVLQLSPTGLATGVATGDAQVVARIGPPNVPHASKWIFVVPKGTFVLQGNIREQGVAIHNVTVLVTSGTGQGLSSRGGFYRFYGVAGPVQLELRGDGIHTASHQVNVVETMTRDFEVVSVRRPDYRGTYTVTLTASPDCTGFRNLPEEARRREYIATVSHDGARIAVSLNGADFLTANGRGSGFAGQLSTYEWVNFKISDASWDDYGAFVPGPFDIAERVGDSTVVFEGSGSAQITDSRFSGTLGGTIAVSRNATPPFAPFIATCWGSHRFEMVRR